MNTRTPVPKHSASASKGEVLSVVCHVELNRNLLAAKFGGGLVSPR